MDSKAESTKFPQFRRYKNGLSYFRIISDVECEEIKILGEKSIKQLVLAKQYPEKVFIHNLLYNYRAFADAITEADYLGVK